MARKRIGISREGSRWYVTDNNGASKEDNELVGGVPELLASLLPENTISGVIFVSDKSFNNALSFSLVNDDSGGGVEYSLPSPNEDEAIWLCSVFWRYFNKPIAPAQLFVRILPSFHKDAIDDHWFFDYPKPKEPGENLCSLVPSDSLKIVADFRGKKIAGRINYFSKSIIGVITDFGQPLEDRIYFPASNTIAIKNDIINGRLDDAVDKMREISKASLRILKMAYDVFEKDVEFVHPMYEKIEQEETNRNPSDEPISYQQIVGLERELYGQWRSNGGSEKDYCDEMDELYLLIPRIDDMLGRIDFRFSNEFKKEFGVMLPAGLVRMFTLINMRKPNKEYNTLHKWHYLHETLAD